MMKLIKDININKYRVLADYKVKVKNSPFMAVLQLATENNDKLDVNTLYEDLLKPLSYKACENLLYRLTTMDYFNHLYDEYYELTEFGKESIETTDFYDKRNGLLKIWVAEENEFTPRIVKIKELPYDEDNKTKTQEINRELTSLQNSESIITLTNDSFTIDHIKEQIKYLERNKEELVVTPEEKNTQIKLADFIGYRKDTRKSVQREILTARFEENYKSKEEIVLVKYKPENLSFVRTLKINEPKFNSTIFNKIEFTNIKVNPISVQDAKDWHLTLVKQRINKYFLSEKEFNDYANNIANEFELYKTDLQNNISRENLIYELGYKRDFYSKVKLETIDYLTY